MNARRTLLQALAACVLTPAAAAQAQPDNAQAALREAVAAYEKAWNAHDVKAWAAMLTDDVWYTEASDFYQRNKGRDKVVPLFEYNVKNSDIRMEIQKLHVAPDGVATVALRHVAMYLPKKDGKYASVFESTPSVSQWRQEGGRWKMFFFTSDKGWALDVMKKSGMP